MAYLNENQIGEITEITGDAIIIRADGSEHPVTLGMEIFEGDIVETSQEGAVNIGFIDDSSFAVSADARVTIDEFIFDPATEAGAQDFSVARGVFMYTSGLIGRENPDSVEIDTPVGSIGIRGTIIGGNINPDGESQVTVVEGAIVVRNNGGEQLLTSQYDTVRLTSIDTAPSAVETLSVENVANVYGSVKTVSSELFSSFNDQMNEQGPSDNLDESSVSEDVEAEANEENKEEVSEDIAEEAAKQDIQNESKGDKKIELKTMDGDDKGKESVTESVSREEVAEKTAQFRNDNNIDEQVNVKLLKQISDETFIFKVGSTVDENSPAGTVVGEVGPNRKTSFDVKYELVNDVNGLLAIDENTGVVTLKNQAPDFEAYGRNIADVRVRATRTDNGDSKEFNLHVFLNDVNDETPTDITLSNNLVVENDLGVLVGNLSATDLDAGDTLTYALVDDANGLFEIVGSELRVASGEQLNYESATSHTVTVSVTDSAGNTSQETLTINVSDVNDGTPTDITLSNNLVVENDLGVLVGNLSATDPDAGDTLTYALVDDASGLFEIVGSELRVASGEQLDYESATSHTVTVSVTDSTGNTSQETLTINVSDANEIAQITGVSTNNAIDEGILSNDVVVADLDFTEVDAYSTTSFATNDPRFQIVNNAGQLQLIAVSGSQFDFETEGSMVVSISQTDGTNTYANYDVTVQISDLIDETPTDITLSTTELDEDAVDASVVATLITTDADTNDTHTYTIQNDSSGIFEIVGNEIRVRDSSGLDYETATSHSFDLVTTDSNGLSYTQNVTLDVNNVNEVHSISLDINSAFDKTGNIIGLIPMNADGAIIGTFNIGSDQPYDVNDISIQGNIFNSSGFNLDLANIFEVVDENGEYDIKLRDGLQIMNVNELHNASGHIGNLVVNGDNIFRLAVEVDEASFTLDFALREVTQIATGGSEYAIQDSDDIILGTDGDDNFFYNVLADDFKLIRGGEGHDVITLDGEGNKLPNGMNQTLDIFDLRAHTSNLSSDSMDLSGIEEIILGRQSEDTKNVLQMNVEDIVDLLRTSSTQINGKNILKITAQNFMNTNDKYDIEIYHNGGEQSIATIDTDGVNGADFVKSATDYTDANGHTYQVFEHELGNLLLDTNLAPVA